MAQYDKGYLSKARRDKVENRLKKEKRIQSGISFPSALKQRHLLIIRFDILDDVLKDKSSSHKFVRNGLKQLCELFDTIYKGNKKIEEIEDNGEIKLRPLSDFNFSSTIGFGNGFFEKLNIPTNNRPKRLEEMPNSQELGDPVPYILKQTDFIVQLGSQVDYVNRWIFHNSDVIAHNQEDTKYSSHPGHLRNINNIRANTVPQDILNSINNWAKITDIHVGFQRTDGKSLLGFNDGISNPDRLSNTVVWTTIKDEQEKFKDSTYMVFQKIEHDLERWQSASIDKQEEWLGRSKWTGLLLGTLSKYEDRKLGFEMRSDDSRVRNPALRKWKRLYKQQQNPETRFYDSKKTAFKNIQKKCPVTSHVRMANPRQENGAEKSIIFRRGYLYIEGGELNGKSNSGLLFISFQKDIKNSFENIKKNLTGNQNLPNTDNRANFKPGDLKTLSQNGRFMLDRDRRTNHPDFTTKNTYRIFKDNTSDEMQDRGKDKGASAYEKNIFPGEQILHMTTLGGGYYFIPPIPNKKISNISEQFFD